MKTNLFGEPEDLWREEWVGMPEFEQQKLEPFATIICRFETKDDLDAFSALIKQKLGQKTKSIWFPFRSHWGRSNKRWVDES